MKRFKEVRRRAVGQVHAKIDRPGVYLLLSRAPDEPSDWIALTLEAGNGDTAGAVHRFSDVWFTLGFSVRIA